MNRLYDMQVETARAEQDLTTESRQKLSNIRSTSKEKLSERSNVDNMQNYPVDQNLDVIFENLNENFTRTDMLQSYQVWTQLADIRYIIRRISYL